ncbi:hypothetical protein BKA70DRAFT_1297775 [Coprinopsis sp. MPI-PUGE-AT-0042]|nr:hypothetical protein BKA70DRAFT_1297775 [Coprinopsis sp. MPI-PUGE-AT-0042]
MDISRPKRTSRATVRARTPEPSSLATGPPTSRSTPFGTGTASVSRDKTNGTRQGNIAVVKEDLKRTPEEVPFVDMLKAILKRSKDLQASMRPKQRRASASKAEGEWVDKTFLELLKEGIKYCNSEKAKPLKTNVAKMLENGSEKGRYTPLVNGLNAVLSDYSGVTISGLNHAEGQDDLIYIVQDPTLIDSEPLTTNTKNRSHRKPDIIGTSIQHLRRLDQTSRTRRSKPFGELVKNLSEEPERDCWMCWELKRAHAYNVDFRPFTLEKVLAFDPPVTALPHPGRPHNFAEEVFEEHQNAEPEEEENLSVTLEVQASFYGIEMLRARWDRMHSIVLVLRDQMLSLRWYDSQGCISTQSIDIVEQMPLLVLTMMLFQRLDSQMRGTAFYDLKATIDGKVLPFDIPDDAHSPWELIGRHTVTATPRPRQTSPKPLTSDLDMGPSRSKASGSRQRAGRTPLARVAAPKTELQDLFFKLLWREERRDMEGVIIETAIGRANHYLRRGIPNGLQTISQRLLLSPGRPWYQTQTVPKLVAFDDVLLRRVSLHFLWQLLRCVSFSLMEAGHRTRRVSLRNFMIAVVDGIRQGSTAYNSEDFLASDLLEQPKGNIPRLYRHDLESFLWCIVRYVDKSGIWTTNRDGDVLVCRGTWIKNWVQAYDGVRPGLLLAQDQGPEREWVEIITQELAPPTFIGIQWLEFSVPSK